MEPFKNKHMILNFIKLFTGGFVGFKVAAINIQLANISEIFSNHIGIANGLIGLVVGILTIIFLFWQIKKIILDYKIKKKANSHE
jgi:hypothetical protein